MNTIAINALVGLIIEIKPAIIPKKRAVFQLLV